MELGSKEWLETARKVMDFSKTYVFYYTVKGHVICGVVDSKAQIGRIQYNKIGPPVLTNSDHAALLGVHAINDEYEYLDIVKYYTDIWKPKK